MKSKCRSPHEGRHIKSMLLFTTLLKLEYDGCRHREPFHMTFLHLFVAPVNDKRFVAALIAVKRLKHQKDSWKGFKYAVSLIQADIPNKLILKSLQVTHKNQYPWIG